MQQSRKVKRYFSDETIEQMFVRNSDGAGYMYVDHGRVRIRKGFMKLVDLKQSLASLGDVTDIPMVFHFRITTHGGTQANCHPFPVTSVVSFLQAEKVICDLGMVQWDHQDGNTTCRDKRYDGIHLASC